MKITLSVAEATVIARANFAAKLNVSDLDVDLNIQPDVAPFGSQTNSYLYIAVQHVRRFDFKGHEKVAAIKAIREFSSQRGHFLSLAEAKFFVESIA